MAIWEAYDSRDRTFAEGTKSRATTRWIVDGTTDDQTVMNTAVANIPTTFRGLVLDSLDVERVGYEYWEVTAQYRDPDAPDQDEKPELGEIIWSFDTGGGMTHITQSKAGNTTSYAGAGVTARDFKGAIGVSDGGVEGVDIIIPSLRLQAQARLTNATITDSWVRAVARLTGKTNDNTWYSYEPGELLFLGASGEQKVNGDPTITFMFEASENVNNLTYKDFNGNDVNVASKAGHEYLWVSYTATAGGDDLGLLQKPHTVFVETVYDEGDFTILGLGS